MEYHFVGSEVVFTYSIYGQAYDLRETNGQNCSMFFPLKHLNSLRVRFLVLRPFLGACRPSGTLRRLLKYMQSNRS